MREVKERTRTERFNKKIRVNSSFQIKLSMKNSTRLSNGLWKSAKTALAAFLLCRIMFGQ